MRDQADPVSVDLHRAGTGDEQAFARVFDALSPMVLGVAARVVRAEALAEEIAQDVFVEAWRLSPQFDPARGSARSWLATIAHRRAVDRVRSEQARRNREQHDSRFVSRPHDGVSEAVLDHLDRRQLTAAFGVLSAVQRQAIELAYYEGRTYRDVAVLLDIAEGTAKTRIREGLHRLRAAMGATA
jgi:RNA polymerase sigma-70 factor, ECF subfamily